jgi:hypothetical protein
MQVHYIPTVLIVVAIFKACGSQWYVWACRVFPILGLDWPSYSLRTIIFPPSFHYNFPISQLGSSKTQAHTFPTIKKATARIIANISVMNSNRELSERLNNVISMNLSVFLKYA